MLKRLSIPKDDFRIPCYNIRDNTHRGGTSVVGTL